MKDKSKGREFSFCPLLSLSVQAGIHGVPCAEAACKWWDSSSFCCAILTVARNLDYIDDGMKGEEK